VRDAASGIEACIAEGFARFVPGEFAQFLRYALGSLKEAETRLTDGVHRSYFTAERCQLAFTWARRCRAVTAGLRASQEQFAEKQRVSKTRRARGSGGPKSDGPPPRSRS
jgi:four helix bundle protein